MNTTRSFLKWAGSKYSCLNKILPSFPKANRFIEPFAGSGTIFLNTNYANNIIAEENDDLINLFLHLKNGGVEFINYCEKFFNLKNNNEQTYYKLREEFNKTRKSKKRAAIFLYLNRHGYNGLCRYNRRGIYNVPFGRYIKPYFPQNEMLLFHEKSSNACFIKSDFLETFKIAQPGDFIYCDPPYHPIQQASNFSSYTSKKFGEKEQIALTNAAKDAALRGITVIISNHDTVFTRQLYKDAEIKTFQVTRYISRDINRRVPVNELIAIFI